MKRQVAVLLSIAVVLLTGCSSGTETGDSGSDGIAALSCDHFRNIAGDADDGLLTNAELRAKLKEVYSNSAGAGPAIRSAARQMLSEITAGHLTAAAINAMDDACYAAGH